MSAFKPTVYKKSDKSGNLNVFKKKKKKIFVFIAKLVF